jgi:hypothetical protein
VRFLALRGLMIIYLLDRVMMIQDLRRPEYNDRTCETSEGVMIVFVRES